MSTDAESSKVLIKDVVGLVSGARVQKDGRFAGEEIQGSIDSHMLQWLKALDLPEREELDFIGSLGVYAEQVGCSLRQARRELLGANQASLESIALELSHSALKMGAVKILRASFELQNLARCGAFRDAQDVVDQIEVEYLKVQQGLENVV